MQKYTRCNKTCINRLCPLTRKIEYGKCICMFWALAKTAGPERWADCSVLKCGQSLCMRIHIVVLLSVYMPQTTPLTPPPLCSSPCFLCTYSHLSDALKVHWRSHLKAKTLVHTPSSCCMCVEMWHLKKDERACFKKRQGGGCGGCRGGAVERQKCASVPHTDKVPCACLLPGVGKGDATCQYEGAGWMTSHHPFSSSNFPFIL